MKELGRMATQRYLPIIWENFHLRAGCILCSCGSAHEARLDALLSVELK